MPTYTSSSTYNPGADGSVLVDSYGAGGGGASGAGGGGGFARKNSYTVSAQSYTITIGAAGTGGRCNNSDVIATAGGNTSFATTVCIGNGGGQGLRASVGGSGGAGGGGTGDTVNNGGAGGNNTDPTVGGGSSGGGAGGPTSAGTAGHVGTPTSGDSWDGGTGGGDSAGTGGHGAYTDAFGKNGIAATVGANYGAGGGGGTGITSPDLTLGAAGAGGFMSVTFTAGGAAVGPKRSVGADRLSTAVHVAMFRMVADGPLAPGQPCHVLRASLWFPELDIWIPEWDGRPMNEVAADLELYAQRAPRRVLGWEARYMPFARGVKDLIVLPRISGLMGPAGSGSLV